VKGTVPGVAEDEFAFDGRYYWGECKNRVSVLQPGDGLPTALAAGSLTLPNRPRGFFTINNSIYASGSQDFKLYLMSFTGITVYFKALGALGDHSLPTRDTTFSGGMLYAYETGPGADAGQMQARIFVYDNNLQLEAVLPVPGPALPSDASQHTLIPVDHRIYFVTESSVGYVNPFVFPDGPETAMRHGGSTQAPTLMDASVAMAAVALVASTFVAKAHGKDE
jgi:hypothetical protein